MANALDDWYNLGRLPNESTMGFKELMADDIRQLTHSDEAFKTGKTSLQTWNPLKAFTPKMLKTGPSPAVRQVLERGVKPIASALPGAAAGYSVYDAGKNLMEGNYLDAGIAAAGVTLPGAVGGLSYSLAKPALENAGFGDFVQDLGLADSSIGQSIAEALMGYTTPDLTATPDYSQMISTEDILNFASNPLMSSAQADPIATTGPTMAENLLLDNNGNLFKASSNESYQAAIEQGYARPATQTGPTMADVAGPTVDYEPTIEPSPPSPALIDDPFNRPWATDSQRSSGPSGLDLSDPGEPLGFGTTHGNLFDRQGNVKKFTNDQNFYSALMGGYSYGPRDFYLEQGYLNNPLVMSRYGGWNTGT